ncbi:SymE family type I addiction module toxin [Atlantibacter subterraneus]|uniref:SymE family type I addiction module toxin n=1 Tax=Atlantibacter subterraneus TaxID=255519 RepID=UPI0028A74DFE|nr:SymE family type I addiction module toxin [Atlantibacter subterranea]
MAVKNSKPGRAVSKTESEVLPENKENRDLIRKNSINRLHGKETVAAATHPRADTPQGSDACCELYSRVDCRYLPLSGNWLTNAGFIDGMPVKIRVMKDCIVITPQHTRELWGCLEGIVSIPAKRPIHF